MRKFRIFLSSFLAFSYLILSVGIDLKAHYCHNDLASFSLSFVNSNCLCGNEKNEMNCCSTEETLIQFDQPCLVQQKLSTEADQAYVENEIEYLNTVYQKEIRITASQQGLESIGPKIFILNSSFLFYS